jgi:hypothetical protein
VSLLFREGTLNAATAHATNEHTLTTHVASALVVEDDSPS